VTFSLSFSPSTEYCTDRAGVTKDSERKQEKARNQSFFSEIMTVAFFGASEHFNQRLSRGRSNRQILIIPPQRAYIKSRVSRNDYSKFICWIASTAAPGSDASASRLAIGSSAREWCLKTRFDGGKAS
jgi:hypothetical protein